MASLKAAALLAASLVLDNPFSAQIRRWFARCVTQLFRWQAELQYHTLWHLQRMSVWLDVLGVVQLAQERMMVCVVVVVFPSA